MRIVRQTQSQDQIDKNDSKVTADELNIERVIYRKLSSLTDNKVIQDPADADSEYSRFLLHMNDIQADIGVEPSVMKLDEYLGELGVSKEYPFIDDVYGLDPWIEILDQEEFRNVVNLGTNIVYTKNGTTYNVVHRT